MWTDVLWRLGNVREQSLQRCQSQIIVGFTLCYKLSSLQSSFPLYWHLSLPHSPSLRLSHTLALFLCVCVYMNTECICLVCAHRGQRRHQVSYSIILHRRTWAQKAPATLLSRCWGCRLYLTCYMGAGIHSQSPSSIGFSLNC